MKRFLTLLGFSKRHWTQTKKLMEFMGIQAGVQAVTAVGAFLLIHKLDSTQYAYYTIAFSLLGTMDALANLGLSIGLSTIGGRIWQDAHRLGQLVSLITYYRWRLGLIAATLLSPVLLWMLLHGGAPLSVALLLLLLVLGNLAIQLRTIVIVFVLQLHSQLRRLTLDLGGALLRLSLVVSILCIGWLNAPAVIAVALLVNFSQWRLMNHWASGFYVRGKSHADQDKREVFGLMREGIPNGIFFCIQGQLTIWLISIFGNTQSIAQVGALGRIGLIYVVLGSTMARVIAPAFARCTTLGGLAKIYGVVVAGYTSFGALLVLAAYLVPGVFLLLLGAKYANLKTELFLIILSTAFVSVVNAMWTLNSARGWIKYSSLNIPLSIALQIVLILTLPLNTVSGVLIFSLLSVTPTFFVNVFMSYRGFVGFASARPAHGTNS